MLNLLTLAPLKGYRTEVLAAVSAVGLAASWLVGDTDLTTALIGILTALGTLAAKHSTKGI